MGRNEKGKMKNSKGSANFGNKNPPKNKQVHKDNIHKDIREKSAQPQRKTSKTIIQVKNPTHTTQIPTNLSINKPKVPAQVRQIRGPVDPSKLNEVKQSLIQLQNLINTYEQVQMDKEVNLKNLIDLIESKHAIVK